MICQDSIAEIIYILSSEDMDNDGDIDIISRTGFDVQSIDNIGYNFFTVRGGIGSGSYSNAMKIVDLDNDGLHDILYGAVNEIYWVKNLGGGVYSSPRDVTPGWYSRLNPSRIRTADIDNDGDQDIIYGSDDYKVIWHENYGSGTFSFAKIIHQGSGAGITLVEDIAVKDFDGDGDIDIVAVYDGKLGWFENLGGSNFSSENIINSNFSCERIELEDIDNDGDIDIVAVFIGSIIWIENQNNNFFVIRNIGSVSNNQHRLYEVGLIDLGNDGDQDIILPVNTAGMLIFYENLGVGNFANAQVIDSGFAQGTSRIHIIDMDGDSNEDILLGTSPLSFGDYGDIRWYKSIYGNVRGGLYKDYNANCIWDNLEVGISGRSGIINPGGIVVVSSASGLIELDSLPVGNYTITVDSTNGWTPSCSVTQSFSVVHSDSITIIPHFGFLANKSCSEPEISIHAPFLRPGFSNQNIYVQLKNGIQATNILNNIFVLIEIDSLFHVNSISVPYNNLGNNRYRVIMQPLYPGQSNTFKIEGTVSPNSILGQSLCMEAKLIYIDSCVLDSALNQTIGMSCSTTYDYSNLTVNSYCIQEDSICFVVQNTEGNMTCWSQVRLYIDGQFVLLDSVLLNTNETDTFCFAGDGRTWRMEVDQHPLHPGNSQPSTTIELCGNANNWTPNLVNVLPHDDADPTVDIYCGLVRGSYDPNDKTGYPLGVGTTHDILPNQKMEYRIRFQNTGTDTAFTVVIRDTLSTDFDIFSVQPGVSSHDYTFRMYGPRVLEWTFNNIMLPDSNVNEPLSNGFVVFEVNQQPNLVNGTILENSAGIYFDFNAPVITNTSQHTIDDGIFQPNTPTRYITANDCDSLTINGYHYNSLGTYYQPTSQNGLDSLYVLELIVGPDPQTITYESCDSIQLPNGQTYTQTGVYIDTLWTIYGCDSIINRNIIIENIDLNITSITGVLISDELSTSNISYQWLDCNNGNAPIIGATSQSYRPSSNGNYAVQIDNGICIERSACFNYVLSSNYSLNRNLDIQLYPNPTTGILQLQRTTTERIQVQIIDQLGRILIEQETSQQSATMNMSRLPKGLYFVHINDGQKSITKKIVKE